MSVKYRIIPIGGGGGTPPTPPQLQEKTAQPATSQVVVEPDAGYDGLSQVTVEAVDSTIDNNILSQNIKNGVTILGVTGSYAGEQPTGTQTITNNGTYDISQYQYVEVDVVEGDFDYFYLEAKQANSTVRINSIGDTNLHYSTDDKATWHQWDGSTITLENIGDKLYLYGNNPLGVDNTIDLTGQLELGGDITTLLSRAGGYTILTSNALRTLFSGQSSLVGDLDLSSITTLKYRALESAFNGTSITSVDVHNVTDVEQSSFYNAFSSTNITSFELPNLLSIVNNNNTQSYKDGAFASVCSNCRHLTTVDFSGVTEINTDNNLFNSAFSGCDSLTDVDFSSLRRVRCSRAFHSAFNGCSSLVNVDFSSLDTLYQGGSVFEVAFENCTSLVHNPLTALTTSQVTDPNWETGHFNATFKGCTSLVDADFSNLVNITGASNFNETFKNCSSLAEIKMGVETYNSNWYTDWTDGVAQSGVFYREAGANFPTNSTSGIPTGWTVVVAPSISVDYPNRQVTITSNMPNSTIYYTVDGTTPTTSSTQYTGAISVPSGVNYYDVRAITSDGTYTTEVSKSGFSNFFYVEAAENNTEFTCHVYEFPWNALEYSTDLVNWTENWHDGETNTPTFTLANQGDKVYFRDAMQIEDDGIHALKVGNCEMSFDPWVYDITGSINVGGCLSTLCWPTSKPNQTMSGDSGCYSEKECGFRGMFNEQTGLKDISNLVFDIDDTGCRGTYYDMFRFCSNITGVDGAKIFPIHIFGTNKYNAILSGTPITSIDLSHVLTVTGENVMMNAFAGCSSLASVNLSSLDVWNSSHNEFQNWMEQVAPTGTFTCNPDLNIPINSNSGIPTGWTRVDTIEYFYIENIYNGVNNIHSHTHGTPNAANTEYSKDKQNWTSIDFRTTDLDVNLNQGEKLYMRSTNGLGNAGSANNYISLYTSQNVNIGGDLKTLIDYRDATIDTLPENAFVKLFTGYLSRDFKVVDASDLTMDGILYADYNSLNRLFEGCQDLVTPPLEFPARYGSDSCYGYCFNGCVNMTSAPVIKLDTYWSGKTINSMMTNMFNGCSSLTSIDLSNVQFMGKFAASNMFNGCSNLRGPVIINTQASNGWAGNMFKDCSSLDDIRYLGSNWTSGNAQDWVSGVAATGDFYNLGGATLPTGTNGIPSGWTTHTSL